MWLGPELWAGYGAYQGIQQYIMQLHKLNSYAFGIFRFIKTVIKGLDMIWFIEWKGAGYILLYK